MQAVLFSIGGIEIHYYGLMYAIAFLVGVALAKRMAKERGMDPAILEDYAFIAIFSGLLGGRLYYVAFNAPYYLAHPAEILAVWHGGMAIHGGILGGVLGTCLYGRWKKLSPLLLGDYAAAPLILGQAIGRIGNLMNGEIHGVPTFTPFSVIFHLKPQFTTWYQNYLQLPWEGQAAYPELVPWGLTFPLESPAGAEFPFLPLHPAMLYELFLNLVAFCILWFVLRKKKKPVGYLWWMYLIFYSINRSIVSFFRAEDLMFFGYRAPHVISLVLIAVALLGLYIGKRKEEGC